MATRTIPTELFLLLTNDAGRQEATQHRRQVVVGAALVELALRERIALGEQRNPTIEVLDAAPTGQTDLDHALAALTELKRRRVQSVIAHRSMDPTEVIGESLVAEGAVTRKDGWFTTTWPARDDTIEGALRARLAAAVTDPSRASLQDGLLLELLRAQRNAYRILRHDLPGITRRELDRTIRDLGIDHPVATSVRRYIDGMNAAAGAA